MEEATEDPTRFDPTPGALVEAGIPVDHSVRWRAASVPRNFDANGSPCEEET